MRFYFLILFIWVPSLYSNIRACDVCGCASMGFSMGEISPNSKYSIASNFGFRSFSSQNFSDNFLMAELAFTYRFKSKYFLEMRIPLLSAERSFSDSFRENESLSGAGDLSITFGYEVLNLVSSKSFRSLLVSVGTNLPTGSYQNSTAIDPLSPNFQLGSASIDFLASLAYEYNSKNYMGFGQVAYLLNTRNRYDYTFGNQAFVNFKFGRKISRADSKLNWLLFAGLSGEHFARDINQRSFYQAGSGGAAAFLDLGAYIFYKQWRASLSYLPKIAQSNSSNYLAGDQLKLKFNYSF